MSQKHWVIERLGHHGDGVAEGPVFAPITLPGEEVTGRLEGQQLEDVRIIKPSDARVTPPCRHFRSCGGCSVQHASDEFVRNWRQDIVRVALANQGIDAEFIAPHVSPPMTRRRASFSARRTKKSAMAGFHARASNAIVEIPGCKILHPDLLAGTNIACELAQNGGSRKAELSVSITVTENGLDVEARGGKPLDGPLRAALGDIGRRNRVARLSWEKEVVFQDRPPEQRFGQARVVPPPGAFLQATREGELTLIEEVRAHLVGAKRVVDLFAGCGTFTFPLAENAQVHAVEGDSEMVEALKTAWRNVQGLKTITADSRDLFRDPLEAAELTDFDAVCLDPPRAGAETQVRALAKSDVQRIAYVSCSPTSFARDSRILIDAGFEMSPVKVVDQFRWSPHVELVAGFTRNA